MANSPSFVEYVLDLLAPIEPSTARAMFGAHGLYADGAMFGLLDDGELFLKTDAQTEATFVEAGCEQFVYPGKKGPMAMEYRRPPASALEDTDALRPWVELALAASRRKQAAKAARVAKPRAQAAPRAKNKASARKPSRPAKPRA